MSFENTERNKTQNNVANSAEEESKAAMKKEEKNNQENSLDEGLRQKENLEDTQGNFLEIEQPKRKALSLTSIIQAKAKISQFVTQFHAKREEVGIVDKQK